MANPFKSLLRLLKDSSVSKVELSAGPPFAKLVFDKAELQALLQGQSRVSDVLATCFVRRRVFWEDIRRENREAVLASLRDVEAELDERSTTLASSGDVSVVGLAKFVRAWATGTALIRKELADRLREIDDEKASTPGYDWAGEDREQSIQRALVSLREHVYPLVTMLNSFLSDDDPTKSEAQRALDIGLNLVPDAAIQRAAIPDVDEVSGQR